MMIIDAHVHIAKQFDIDHFCRFVLKRADKANILACSHSECLSLFLAGLKCKQSFPDRFYCFTEPDPYAFYFHKEDLGTFLAKDTDLQLTMGADGVKLLHGKPQMRKKYPIPDFDAEVWEPFWKYCEERQIPILMHLNDPEEFWQKDKAPSFAITQGWLYDETYVNNEEQYTEMLRVLSRHPLLKICFAHFMFLSKQSDRLSDILDRYPNVYVDLTPGIEMYENFSLDLEKTKAFFYRYHDRILYGTDIGGRCVLMGEGKNFDGKENDLRPLLVQNFLTGNDDLLIESDGHYLIDRPSFVMHCLGLKGGILDDITYRNFENFVSGIPKEIDLSLIGIYKQDLRKKLDEMKEIRGFTPDYSLLDIRF